MSSVGAIDCFFWSECKLFPKFWILLIFFNLKIVPKERNVYEIILRFDIAFRRNAFILRKFFITHIWFLWNIKINLENFKNWKEKLSVNFSHDCSIVWALLKIFLKKFLKSECGKRVWKWKKTKTCATKKAENNSRLYIFLTSHDLSLLIKTFNNFRKIF